MKFKSVVVRSILAALVVVSLVLSGLIWTNNQRFSSMTNTTSLKVAKKESSQQASTVLPTQTIINVGDKTYQIYDGKKNLPLAFNNQLKNSTATKYKLLTKNKTDYQEFLTDNDYLQFAYSDEITVKSLLEVYGLKKLSVKNGVSLNRIFVPKKNSGVIYLGSDRTENIYQLSLQKFDGKKLYDFAQNAESRLDIVLTKMDGEFLPYYQQENAIHIYNYLVTTQPESYYVSKFFDTSEIETKASDDNTVYTSGLYKRLSINRATQMFDFTNYEDDEVPKNLSSALLKSYDYLEKSGINLANIRYFSHTGSMIEYNYFVEGLPVFVKNDFQAAIKTEFKASGLNIKFINLNLQIPIPEDDQTVNVPKTETVIKNLVDKGYAKDKIKRIFLAFKLQQDGENPEIISLVPTMYVKIDNQWQDYQSWLDTDIKK